MRERNLRRRDETRHRLLKVQLISYTLQAQKWNNSSTESWLHIAHTNDNDAHLLALALILARCVAPNYATGLRLVRAPLAAARKLAESDQVWPNKWAKSRHERDRAARPIEAPKDVRRDQLATLQRIHESHWWPVASEKTVTSVNCAIRLSLNFDLSAPANVPANFNYQRLLLLPVYSFTSGRLLPWAAAASRPTNTRAVPPPIPAGWFLRLVSLPLI